MKNFQRHPMALAIACLVIAAGAELATAQAPRQRWRDRQPPAGVEVIRDLAYATVGDTTLRLDLYLPKNADGPLPVIVGIHGGGWANGSKEGGQSSWLSKHGYAVAVINYRLTGVAPFPAQIEDCKAAVRWLRANARKYGLDPERIGANGHSAGGHLTSLLATSGDVAEFEKGDNLEHSSRVQAAVPSAGPTDFLQMDAHRRPGAPLRHDAADSPEARLVGGPIQERKDVVAKANPITYVSRDDPPFLIIHGDSDPVVPAHQAQLLDAALTGAGVDHQLHIVEGAGHAVGGPQVQTRILEFFDTHLKSSTAFKINGVQAPDFTLSSPDGGTTVTLSKLRGKPVVIVFGSCTCPPFVRSTSLVAPLHEQYRGRVHFLMVYIREAHPIGGREIPGNPFQIEAPTTYAERCEVATKFDERIGIAMPIVVDSIDDRVAGLYAPWPNRVVVIDADGMIADKGVAAPHGTRDSANQLTDILDRLLEGN